MSGAGGGGGGGGGGKFDEKNGVLYKPLWTVMEFIHWGGKFDEKNGVLYKPNLIFHYHSFITKGVHKNDHKHSYII